MADVSPKSAEPEIALTIRDPIAPVHPLARSDRDDTRPGDRHPMRVPQHSDHGVIRLQVEVR
ncbi:MAG: hypothetical protein ACK55I_33680, partial [bacterium]